MNCRNSTHSIGGLTEGPPRKGGGPHDAVLNVHWSWSVSYGARRIQNAELHMDTTTLLIIVLVLVLLFGGGWYGRGRWY